MSQNLIFTVIVANIFLLLFSTFNLFKRKHIVNLLIAISVGSLIILEIAKFSLFSSHQVSDKIVGFGNTN